MRLRSRMVLFLILPFCLTLCGKSFALGEPANRVQCYTAWDSEYFYAAFTVHKPNLVGSQSAPFGDPTKDDSVAVFLQLENGPVGTKRSDKSVEMAVSAAGGAQLYRGANATPLKGVQDFITLKDGDMAVFKYAVTTHGTLNQPGGVDNSYTVELAIPWVELGGPPNPGEKMLFNEVAFSADPQSPAVMSLSPKVTTLSQVQDPSLWEEIVFVDSPVKSVASAPNAKVCARVVNAKPLIDGHITEGEWNELTAFGFAALNNGKTVSVNPNLGEARVRPEVQVHPGGTMITPPAPFTMKPRTASFKGAIPKWTFARYFYNIQNDPRKSDPLNPIVSVDGMSLIANHYAEGCGSWISYDRIGWQLSQLTSLRNAGVEVALPVFKADMQSRHTYSRRGLMTMVAALNNLSDRGKEYPLVAMYLDTPSFVDLQIERTGNAELPDLTKEEVQAEVYAAVKEFFTLVPSKFCAEVNTGGVPADILFLSNASAFSGMDQSAVNYLRSHFAADFGRDLIIIGDSGFKGKLQLDGYFGDAYSSGYVEDDGGPIKIASVSPGYDGTIASPNPTNNYHSREAGARYKNAWNKALAAKCNWVMIQDWNNYAFGTEVEASMEYGLEYMDYTRVFTRMLESQDVMPVSVLNEDIPAACVAGKDYVVHLVQENMGVNLLPANIDGMVFQWQPVKPGGQSYQSVSMLTFPLYPTVTTRMKYVLSAPKTPGDYVLTGEIADVNKKGEVTKTLPGINGSPSILSLDVHVADKPDASLPQWSATVIRSSLPSTLETNGAYTAQVTLRNDGFATWQKSPGSVICGQLWNMPLNSDGSGSGTPVDMADASITLPNDVPPGAEVQVSVPIVLSDGSGSPLPQNTMSDDWTYLLRWGFSMKHDSDQGAMSHGSPVMLIGADIGAQFTVDMTPSELPAQYRLPIKIDVRNMGPQIWRRDMAFVGYHWYYLDGTPVVWEDELTPIQHDLLPGQGTSDMLAWITAPPNDGYYWLEWDVKVGQTWCSTTPAVRPFETTMHLIHVINGQLSFIDLSKYYNMDVTERGNPQDKGALNSEGVAIPSELVPPYSTGYIAPSTMWLPVLGTGTQSPRRISFQWGPKGEGEKNAISCAGQKIMVPYKSRVNVPLRYLHVLLTTTEPDTTAAFTLMFADGSQQYFSLPFSLYTGKPKYGEELGWFCRYSRTQFGDLLNKPLFLFHLKIPISDQTSLTQVILPNAPAIKIFAMTAEK